MKPLSHVLVLLALIIDAWGDTVDRSEIISLERAHEMALLNAPNVTLAQLGALIALDQVSIARAGYLPNVTANVTMARAASDNTRLAAGALNNPSVYDREAGGVTVTQLITDFGRTTGQIDAVRMHAWAEGKRSQATIDQILMEVDLLYYRTLQSQARVAVANQTVANRQVIVDRVGGLVANKLKSELDLSFANVTLEEGRMLQAQVSNELTTNQLTLAALLGFDAPQPFQLMDQPVTPPPADGSVATAVAQALGGNPIISRLRLEVSSALRAYDSARALDYPTLNAIGAAGYIVDHDPRLANSYAAGALNLSIPLYSGNAIASQQHEASVRIEMARAALRAAEDELSRDVRVALAGTTYTYARLDMAKKLMTQAALSYDLAKSRFDLGLTSIVDLNQADLNRTDAAMTESTAKQEYLIKVAILNNRLGAVNLPAKRLP
jgi:outer membrane protein